MNKILKNICYIETFPSNQGGDERADILLQPPGKSESGPSVFSGPVQSAAVDRQLTLPTTLSNCVVIATIVEELASRLARHRSLILK